MLRKALSKAPEKFPRFFATPKRSFRTFDYVRLKAPAVQEPDAQNRFRP